MWYWPFIYSWYLYCWFFNWTSIVLYFYIFRDRYLFIHDIELLFEKDYILFSHFRNIKRQLISCFITIENYSIIVKRIIYYDSDEKDFPHESCVKQLSRRIFNIRNPYYSEYRMNRSYTTISFKGLINNLRKSYGYSKRCF